MGVNWILGRFTLSFEAGGKLEKLSCAGGPNWLNAYEWAIDLGGKTFRPAGWDECFPTIDPYGQSPVMGELVCESPEMSFSSNEIHQTWVMPRFRATRTFSTDQAGRLVMTFTAKNCSDQPLEYLWASHALFSVDSIRKVLLPDGQLLTEFHPNGSEKKSFIAANRPIMVQYETEYLILETDQPWWGIWFDRGGWPAGAEKPVVCLGLEATSTPAEHPAGFWLAVGETFSGRVQLAIHHGNTSS